MYAITGYGVMVLGVFIFNSSCKNQMILNYRYYVNNGKNGCMISIVDSLVSECTASSPLPTMLIISSDNARGQMSSLILIRQWYSARSIQCIVSLISERSSGSWNLIDGKE